MFNDIKTGELKDLKFLADRSGLDDVDNEQLRMIISDEYRLVINLSQLVLAYSIITYLLTYSLIRQNKVQRKSCLIYRKKLLVLVFIAP